MERDLGTFGERFLEEWKRLGGPLSSWSYAEIQELRACDREGMVSALRRHDPLVDYAAIQRIRTAEGPEELARTMLVQQQAASGMALAASASPWGLFLVMRG